AADQSKVTNAAFSRDGSRVVTVSDDRAARVWDVVSGKLVAVLAGHDEVLASAAFSPDGQRVATSPAETLDSRISSTVRILDARSGKPVAIFETFPIGTGRIAFSDDGRRLAAVIGQAQGLVIWRTFSTTQELVDAAKQAVPRCLSRQLREAAFLDPR